jgi:hypothetical protein
VINGHNLHNGAARPVVFGYRIAIETDFGKELRDSLDLIAWARKEGLTLSETHYDFDPAAPAEKRPALAGLLERLARTDAAGIVVPSMNHLPPGEEERAKVVALIGSLGGRLYVAGLGSL